jgi:CRP-like cAMP-binding protein
MRQLPGDVQALGRTPLFRGAKPRELRAAQRFGTFVDAAPGRVLCTPGQAPAQLAVVVTGRVLAVVPSGSYRILGRGECFGALAAAGRPAVEPEGVAAVTATVLFVVSKNELAGLVEACPTFGARFSSRATFTARRQAREREVAWSRTLRSVS